MKKYIYASLFIIVILTIFPNTFTDLSASFFSLFNNNITVDSDNLEFTNNFSAFDNKNSTKIKKRSFKKIISFLKEDTKISKLNILETSQELENSFAVSLILYRPGYKRILVVRKGLSFEDKLNKALTTLKSHSRFNSVFMDGEIGFHLQLDVIEDPQELDFFNISQVSLDSNRFEFGVDGLRISCPDKRNYYLLPGDSFVHSLHSINHLKSYVKRLVNKNNYNTCQYQKINTLSFLYNGKKVMNLYRGIPIKTNINLVDIEQVAFNSTSYVLRNQRNDGSFLYYYDAKTDSKADHQHPDRDLDKNPYYNMLRHNGGGLLLLHEFERTQSKKFLNGAKKAAEFLNSKLQFYNDNTFARLLYNQKSKLGGAGTALYFLVQYQRLSNDFTFNNSILALKNHLLKQIQASGEFIYYDIYLNKEVTSESNKYYFNFYYPGEALCALASYYNYIAKDNEKEELENYINKALIFLIDERPVLYPQHFQSLPSDSWFMMAINHLWDNPKFRNKKYSDFVFSEVNQMIDHMYTFEDALFPDYPGSFYYNYGDHPYPDGARAEGVLAALNLAIKIGNDKQINKITIAIKLINLAVYRLVNTPELAYAVKNPSMALWAIRFKLTRQWIRVDTIQHVAAFYSKYLYLYKNNIRLLSNDSN